MRGLVFWSALALTMLLGLIATRFFESEFLFFAGYAILQAMIMALAWNILGGFTGYVNFGSAGFFAVGVYSSVARATSPFSSASVAASQHPLTVPPGHVSSLFARASSDLSCAAPLG